MNRPAKPARTESAPQAAAIPVIRRLVSTHGVLFSFAIYFALRWLILNGVQPVSFSDTASYLDQYRQGFGGGLLGRARPWGYPFFLWLTGYRLGLAVALQRALAAVAWFALARAAAVLFRRTWLQRALFFTILVISATLFVIQWDAMLLSESLSVTCFVALTAAWCRLLRLGGAESGRIWLALMAVLAFPFASLRDSSVPLLGLLALFVGGWAGLRLYSSPPPVRRLRHAAAALALAGGLLLAAALHHHEAQVSKRGWANIANVLSVRAFVAEIGANAYILDIDHVNWMARNFQIPAKDAAAHAGHYAGEALPLSPAYRAWLETTGPRAWFSFLLHHPGWLIRNFSCYKIFFANATNYVNKDPGKWTHTYLGPAWLIQQGVITSMGWLLSLGWLNILLALSIQILGALWVGSFRWPALGGAAAPLGALLWLTAACLLASLVAFVGDAIETWRHALLGLVALYIAVPVGLCLLAEAGLDWMSRRAVSTKGGNAKLVAH